MELINIKDEENLINNSNQENILLINTNKNNTENVIIIKISKKCKDIPIIIYPVIITILLVIISIIILLAFKSKYEVTYIFEKDTYDKPKYSAHNYSSITFKNGLKLILVQTEGKEQAGASITFDYGYLDNKYDLGIIKLAFLSLIYNITETESYKNYFGYFNYDIEQFYSSFYFQILPEGFQQYLKYFSKLTYLEKNDNRTKQFDEIDLTPDDNFQERKNHLLEYLIYGYKNKQEDLLPQGNNMIKNNMRKDSIINTIEMILRDPSKIKIVLYSQYKVSLMKKYFLKYFTETINKNKISDNNINQLNAYNLSDFETNKIIYFELKDVDDNYIEINYFLNKKDNITYNQLIKDSQYLSYIIYILNRTDEGSLYYELNNNNNISIKNLSSNFEVILKSKLKFSILIYLNHYSYKHIKEILSKVYNYMNNIKLYINLLKNNFNDIRIDELDKISEQNFTFTEDPHDCFFYKKLTTDLFYKDEKDYLLKQMWFSKKDFIENITKVKFYLNQLTINNSVILLGLNNNTKNKYKDVLSDISNLFDKTANTSYFNLTYSINNISDYIKPIYNNNTLQISNPKKNEFISEYDTNTVLDYNKTEDDKFFEIDFIEKSNSSDNYLKLFWKKVTCFHIPKVVITIYFVHPFLRPNFQNDTSTPSKNDKLYFYFLLYMSYVKRTIDEKLADAFRAGSNHYYIYFNEDSFFVDFFVFSDKAKQCLYIIKNILNNEIDFLKALEKKFEIYRDYAIKDFLKSGIYDDLYSTRFAFTKAITGDSDGNFPPIYNFCEFPKKLFDNYSFKDISNDEKILISTIYTIKYIYIFGYYEEEEVTEVYNLFKSTNKFYIPLSFSKFDNTIINDTNFVKKVLERNKFKQNQNILCNIKYKGIYRYLYFSDYTLDDECLINMLIDILTDNKNFNKDIDSGIYSWKLKKIFLIFQLKDKEKKNEKLIKDIFVFLDNYKELTKTVDVIGDGFYYFFEGFKKVSELKHYNMVDSAWGAAYDLFYTKKQHNNVTNLNFSKYEDFKEKIKEIIKENDPYIDLYNKNESFNI